MARKAVAATDSTPIVIPAFAPGVRPVFGVEVGLGVGDGLGVVAALEAEVDDGVGLVAAGDVLTVGCGWAERDVLVGGLEDDVEGDVTRLSI